MYSLTLTADERRAFDWVGDRYNRARSPTSCSIASQRTESGATTATSRSHIPEHVAWEINELAEEEDYAWACFAPSLAGKLNDLCWGIV